MAKLTDLSIRALKPRQVRYEQRDGDNGLLLVIQTSGSKSWAKRFRRPDGTLAKLTLGAYDPTAGKKIEAKPEFGKPLTLAEARVLNADIDLERKARVDVIAKYVQSKRLIVREPTDNSFPAAALDFIHQHAKSKTRRWRETARLLGYDFLVEGGEPTIIKGSLSDLWSTKPVGSVTSDDIYETVDTAKRAGIPGLGRRNKGHSDARGRSMADCLGTMFGWLLEHRRITSNPCIGTHRPAAPAARDRVLRVKVDSGNGDELRWVWTAADRAGEPFGPLVKLLLITGARREEIAQATYDELADDFMVLRLPGSRTKNGRAHDIPLPPLARDILKGLKRRGSRFVFTTTGSSPISGFSKYKDRLDGLVAAEAKKEIPHWTLHDLRRTAATGMAGIGIMPHIIEAVLNHVSGAKASVAGIYNREAYEPEKKAALEKWAAHIEIIVGKKSRPKAK